MICGGSGSAGFDTNGEIICGGCQGDRIDPEPLMACPFDFVTRDIWDALEWAEQAKEHRWPCAGGLLDQCQTFVDFCRFVWGIQRQLENATG
jgi:hypothetical protein